VFLWGCIGVEPHETLIFSIWNNLGNRFTEFPKSREVPSVREIPTLLGFGGFHGASAAFEEDAFPIQFVLKCEALPVLADPGEPLDKIALVEIPQPGKACCFRIAQDHLSGPAATGRATLTLVIDPHALERSIMGEPPPESVGQASSRKLQGTSFIHADVP
jgi:hypothetical protein